jgi:catechol 2,3-dioxygenase-like lactoylglutathione lyase family enzyme
MTPRPTGGAVAHDEPGRLIGFHHVQLAMPPGEERAAIEFYAGVLGLDQVPKPPELADRGGVWFRSGDLEVHLGIEEGFQPAMKAHPAFLVEDVERMRARVEMSGYKVIDDEQYSGFKRVHVRDPFGNRLELVEPAR